MNNWCTNNDGKTWCRREGKTQYLLSKNEGKVWHLRALVHHPQSDQFELVRFTDFDAAGADFCSALELADIVIYNNELPTA